MALRLETPQTIVLSSVQANRWEIGYYRVDNAVGVDQGTTLTVQLLAINQTGPGTFETPLPLPIQTYTGADLADILSKAGELFEYYRNVQHTDLKTAYYLATRDALYARLKADGLIPPDAA